MPGRLRDRRRRDHRHGASLERLVRTEDRVGRTVEQVVHGAVVVAHAAGADPAAERRQHVGSRAQAAEVHDPGRRIRDGETGTALLVAGDEGGDHGKRQPDRDEPAAARGGRQRDGRCVRSAPELSERERREVAARVQDDERDAERVAGDVDRDGHASRARRQREAAQPRLLRRSDRAARARPASPRRSRSASRRRAASSAAGSARSVKSRGRRARRRSPSRGAPA